MSDTVGAPLVQSYNQQQVQVRGRMGGSFTEVSFYFFCLTLTM